MKPIIATLFLALFLAAGVSAQVLEAPPIHLRAWAKAQDNNPGEEDISNAQNRRAISYPYLREADVMWAKRVWQEIDLREKINHPLYYPARPIRHRMSLMSALWEAVMEEGTLTAYSDEDFRLPLTVEEIRSAVEDTLWITVPDPDDPDFDIVVPTPRTFDPADVMFYWIVEDWVFDRKHSVLEKRIIAIAPLRERYTTDDMTGERILQGKELLFWIYFPHARPLLVQTEVFNRFNDTERMTFDDLFFKRFFSGRVIKTDNVYDRFISEYKQGLDAVLESERIKTEYQVFEMDLWEY